MTILEAIQERHSVRVYKDQPIPAEIREQLDQLTQEINEESGLDIEIFYDNTDGFDSRMAHYGNFKNVQNFIVLKGWNNDHFEEDCGYYGEKLVLAAQMLGLNTCWAAVTFNKKFVKKMMPAGEKLNMAISLGYGENQGVPHKGKTLEQVVVTKGNMPDWFRAGAEAALLAPTAMNQQKFKIGLVHGEPAVRIAGRGFYTRTDLGIVKYHFEVASGRKTV